MADSTGFDNSQRREVLSRARMFLSLVCLLSFASLGIGQDVSKFGITFTPLGSATLDPGGATLVVGNIGSSGQDGFSVAPGGRPGASFDLLVEPATIGPGGFVRFGILNSAGTYEMSITDEDIGGGLVQVTAAFPALAASTRSVNAFSNGVLVKSFDHSGPWDVQFVAASLAGGHKDDVKTLGDRQIGVWIKSLAGGASAAQARFPDGSEFSVDMIEFSAFSAGANLPPPHRVAWTFKDVSSFTLTGAVILPSPLPIPTLSEWGVILLVLSLLVTGTVLLMRREAVSLVPAGMPTSGQASVTLFDPRLFVKTFALAMTLVAAGFAWATWRFGAIPARDIAGTMVSATALAYWVHLLLLMRRTAP